MNEDISLISMHPFVRRFVWGVVQNIRAKNFEHREKFVVDADLVPRVSEKVMLASMGTNVIRRDMQELVAPIKRLRTRTRIIRPKPIAPIMTQSRQIVPPVQNIPREIVAAPVLVPGKVIDVGEGYGKITPLFNDNSVSTIECAGEGKELMVIRAGQKQKTRIVLSDAEIRKVLQEVADKTHIPLLDGVFRATLSGFSINAVISDLIGSRFVIKKATAYGLLE